MTALDNPYFDEVAGGVTVGACRDSWSEAHVETLRQRERLVEEYAWGIPNREAIETIADQGLIVEVGAGTGYWAWCVEQLGGTVAATDLNPAENRYRNVAEYDAVRRVRKANIHEPDATLLLVWPPHDTPMAADALEAYEGDAVIYVGEWRGGCTADERFHRALHDGWTLVTTVAIPTYLGLHDRLEVWER